tara:strand:+ start:197 stop:376 length:180 start_codon:yes stop_codon:yes gene_type:complete
VVVVAVAQSIVQEHPVLVVMAEAGLVAVAEQLAAQQIREAVVVVQKETIPLLRVPVGLE